MKIDFQIRNPHSEIRNRDAFYAKVDTTLPERKMKAWERKTANGDEE